MVKLPELKKRIIELSHKHKLAHIACSLCAIGIIDDIYGQMGEDDIFILSQGHAGLALYVALEKYRGQNAEELLVKHGVHPHADLHIPCSTGSLGHGLPIALGMAIAKELKSMPDFPVMYKSKVHCLVSDGECNEGSIWEALQIKKRLKVANLKVYINVNDTTGFSHMKFDRNIYRLMGCNIVETSVDPELTLLQGLQGHYKVLTENEKDICLDALS